MNWFDPTLMAVVAAATVLLLCLLVLRMRRQRRSARRPSPRQDALDTVADWPPQSARVMTIHERQAYDLLRLSLPGFLVLAQVPLARFLRVPTRHSYSDWMQRVGSLSADLALCDAGSRVLAVIDVRAAQETDRSRRRHERMARVLKSAGIRVVVWREGALPSLAEVRSSLGADLAGAVSPAKPAATHSKPMPLIPVPDIEELLVAGDQAYTDAATEPVPSGFFDDIDSVRGGLART